MEIAIIQDEKPRVPVRVCGRCKRPIPFDMRYQRKRRYGLVCQRCLNSLWRAKGYQAERNFVRRLEKLGFNADRIPTSGSGSTNLPDIIAFHPEKRLALAFEVKAIDGSYHKSWTVNAWVEKNGEKKPSQLVKAIRYLEKYYSTGIVRKAGISVKFLLGERVKSPWIVKLIEVTDEMDLEKIPDITVDISDLSDMPELTGSTLSRRSRKIRKVRRERKR